MKKGLIKYLLLISCCIINDAIAQEGMRYNTYKNADTATISRLLEQAQKVNRFSPDSSIVLSKHALAISYRIKDDISTARSLINLGTYLYNDKKGYDQGKALFLEALPYALRVAKKDNTLLPRLYFNLGNAYMKEGTFDSAFNFYYRSIAEINKSQTKDKRQLLSVYSNIGALHIGLQQNDKAIYYLQKAISLSIICKDTQQLAQNYFNVGHIYNLKNNMDSMTYYYNQALMLYRYLNEQAELQNTYASFGIAWLSHKDFKKAKDYFDHAVAVDPNTALNNLQLQQGIGGLYYYQGNYKNAITYYKRSLELSEEEGWKLSDLESYAVLADIYDKAGNGHLAYTYQRRYSELADSLISLEKIKAINLMEIKYRIAEKDKELALSKVQLYKKQKQLIITFAGILLLLVIFAGFWRSSRQKQKLQTVQIRNLEQQKKIEHLHFKMQGEEEERSRIARELHDGINVLLSATKMNYASLGKEYKGLPETESYGEVMRLLNEMGLELRTITYKLVPELLIQQSLPDAVETFCELIRKGNNLYIEFQSWGSFTALPSEYCFAIYRVVQELVHNIIKHAHATSALIHLWHKNGVLCLTVEDNGKGFDLDKPAKGLGIQSVRSRIKDINGQIVFSSITGEGTSVEIEIITTSSDNLQLQPE